MVKPENPFPFLFVRVCPRCKEHREEWTHADSSLPCIGSFIFLLDPTFSIHLPICPPCRATWCMNWDSNSSSGRSGVCFCLKKSQAGPCPRVQKCLSSNFVLLFKIGVFQKGFWFSFWFEKPYILGILMKGSVTKRWRDPAKRGGRIKPWLLQLPYEISRCFQWKRKHLTQSITCSISMFKVRTCLKKRKEHLVFIVKTLINVEQTRHPNLTFALLLPPHSGLTEELLLAACCWLLFETPPARQWSLV